MTSDEIQAEIARLKAEISDLGHANPKRPAGAGPKNVRIPAARRKRGHTYMETIWGLDDAEIQIRHQISKRGR